MDPEIVVTSDGSHTLYNSDLKQHYHSTFGAVQESQHIFINTGFFHTLEKINTATGKIPNSLHILEIGFGTGLNALITLAEAEKHGIRVAYTAIEAFPLDEYCWSLLNYPRLFGSADQCRIFSKLHLSSWNEPEEITSFFELRKMHITLQEYVPERGFFDLVYFDAFGPDAQPELWTEVIFRKIHHGLKVSGMLVTYSVKGDIVRTFRAAGFLTEKLSGPPGKRHILRAIKPG
jgi:tRNA U34 5-methylaminomethyl-2-thiouridine-forming methyltransferase MnmC